MELTITDAARAALAEEGHNPKYGARHLRRTIQRRIEDPLTDALLSETFVPGDIIQCHIKSGEIHFKKLDEEMTDAPAVIDEE